MQRFLALFLLLVLIGVAAAGCKTNSGSQEFIPGKGWVPVK